MTLPVNTHTRRSDQEIGPQHPSAGPAYDHRCIVAAKASYSRALHTLNSGTKLNMPTAAAKRHASA